MSFEGPEAWDFQNVRSLNRAWLDLVRRDPALRRQSGPEARPHLARIAEVDHRQAERLASTPFLLFSFRERDEVLWSDLLATASHRHLFAGQRSRELETLTAAALGFIWQLARRNPYTLRLICGATLYWCERIGELTFFRLLSVARQSDDIPVLRSAGHPTLWLKLLGSGLSPDEEVRGAAQLAALQAMLTEPAALPRRGEVQRAARRSRSPGLRVAERDGPHSRS